MTDILFPDGLAAIGGYAFFDARALATVTLSSDVVIGESVFYNLACCPGKDCEYGAGTSVCQCVAVGEECNTVPGKF